MKVAQIQVHVYVYVPSHAIMPKWGERKEIHTYVH